MATSDFPAVFAELRAMMARHAPELLVTRTPDKKKGDVWFGAVR
jgi:hypothetical protein